MSLHIKKIHHHKNGSVFLDIYFCARDERRAKFLKNTASCIAYFYGVKGSDAEAMLFKILLFLQRLQLLHLRRHRRQLSF